MKKFLTAVGIVTSLGAGAFALNAVLPVSAQESGVTAAASSASDAPTNPAGHPARTAVQDALDKLVANGTITADQENAIKDAVKAEVKADGGGQGLRMEIRKDAIQAAAGSIGITTEELRTDLKNGQSVAQVAQSKGVDPQKVVDDVVAKASTKVDEAVTNGKITADRGNTIKSKLPDVITALVNKVPAGK